MVNSASSSNAQVPLPYRMMNTTSDIAVNTISHVTKNLGKAIFFSPCGVSLNAAAAWTLPNLTYQTNIAFSNSAARGAVGTFTYFVLDPITDRIAKKILTPFYSEHANKSSKMIGEITKTISKIGLALLSTNYVFNTFNLDDSLVHNTIKTAIDDHKIVAGWTGGVIGFLCLAGLINIANKNVVLAKNENPVNEENKSQIKKRYIIRLSFLNEKTVELAKFQSQEDYCDKVIKALASCDADLSRKDLIDSLTNAQNGLLKHYNIQLYRNPTTTSAGSALASYGFIKYVAEDQTKNLKLLYDLKKATPKDLEDEIRDDLGSNGFPLPSRIYN